MAIRSQYPGKCKDCGKEYGINDEIDVNGNKSLNKKGEMKDHWCPDGANCQGVMQLQGSPELKQGDPTKEQFLQVAKKILEENDNIKNPDEFIKESLESHKMKIANACLKWAAANEAMDSIGLQHPSRMAFIRELS